MKKIIALKIIFFLVFVGCHSHKKVISSNSITFVDEVPTFPGGEIEMFRFIEKNLIYPDSTVYKRLRGRALVMFKVNKEVALQDFTIAQSLSSAYDYEAINVLKKMPKWSVGKYKCIACIT